MSTTRQSPEPTVAAAAGLRAAVHELAHRVTANRPDVEALQRAETLVREAAAQLDGDSLPRWWQGRPDTEHERRLRSYRLRSLFQGELHPFSPTLDWDDEPGPDGQAGLRFDVTLPDLYEGPPRSVHGGYLAGLFDELLGAVQHRAHGVPGWTGRLSVRYRSPTPLDTALRFHGWVVDSGSRLLRTAGTCRAGDALCATADGLFVKPTTRAATRSRAG